MKTAWMAGMVILALLAPMCASGAVLTWDVRATAADGAVLSGSFQYSNGAPNPQLLGFDLAIAGGPHADITTVQFDRADSRGSIPFSSAVGFERSVIRPSPASYIVQIRNVSGAGFGSAGTVSISATEHVISGVRFRSEIFAGSATAVDDPAHVLPEPASAGMLGIGLAGALLLLMRRRLGSA
jgi:hypothetical protein